MTAEDMHPYIKDIFAYMCSNTDGDIEACRFCSGSLENVRVRAPVLAAGTWMMNRYLLMNMYLMNMWIICKVCTVGSPLWPRSC